MAFLLGRALCTKLKAVDPMDEILVFYLNVKVTLG